MGSLDSLPVTEDLQELPLGWERQYTVKLVGNEKIVKVRGYFNEHTQEVVQTLAEVLQREKMKQAEQGDSPTGAPAGKEGEQKVKFL